jgi:flavin-dependent dehydrogenase
MLARMKQSHFVKKYSVQFVKASGDMSAPFYFWNNKPHECSQTWQVVRSEFDQMMLDNARESGVEVHEGARVLEVLFADERATGVRVRTEDGAEREVTSAVVVDASGQSALLQNRLGLRVWDPVLNKVAVWSYWKGAYRDSGPDEGATVVLQTANRMGWFWYIPLHDDVVSVGVVAPASYLFEGRGGPERVYREEIERSPAVRRRLADARSVAGTFATKDYSYRSRRVAGDGFVLVGDAFQFLDPLYSSGVLLALRSGALAADAIVEGLRRGDTSGAQLGGWGPAFCRGVDRMRRLVCEYYDGFSFGRFVRSYPDLRGTVTDLLIGDLFDDRVDAVWGPLESLYPPGKTPPPAWDALPDGGTGKQHELVLPDGYRP